MKKVLLMSLACLLLLSAALPALAAPPVNIPVQPVHPAQYGASDSLKEIANSTGVVAASGFWALAEQVFGQFDAAILSGENIKPIAFTGGFVRVADNKAEVKEEPADEPDEVTEEPAEEEVVTPEETVDETEPETEETPEEPAGDAEADAGIEAFWATLADETDTLGNTLKLKYDDIPEGEESYIKLARGGYIWYGDEVYKFDLPGVGYTYCFRDKIGGGSFYKYYTYEEAFEQDAFVLVYPEK